MGIIEAKKELYSRLKVNKAVRGAGIREKDGTEHIVIFLTGPTNEVDVPIPSSYKGNRVVTEQTSIPKAL